ncbi:MAG: hypothetical protein JST92_14100 [Deltaproteobacteria bacterium]|nr:hypothetical protein [Deltaproteobacteria bacterium]
MRLAYLTCGQTITGPAIDWGESQRREDGRDGTFLVKCEACGTVQDYDYFRGALLPR